MANLYDKASLVLPSSPAYKAGVIQAYKPLTDGGTFDFTRATSANRINSDNLIESVGNNVPRMDYTDGSCPSLLLEPQSTNLITYPVSFGNSYWTKSGASIEVDKSTAGSELVTNGDFATDTDWTKQSSWTISGGTANYDAVVNSHYIQQPLVLISGNTYKIEFEVVSGTASLGFYSDSNIILPITAYGVGSHTVYGTTGLVGSNFRMWAAAALGAFSIDNVSVKELQGFTSPSADYPTSAYKLVASTLNTSNHYVYSTFSVNNSTKYTVSFLAKKGEYNFVSTYISALGGSYTWDLNLGTVVLGDASIEDYGNGWFRCTISANSTSTTLSYRIYVNKFENRSTSYQGDGTSGVYIFGAQLEQQSYPTSFIYNGTEGSSVTRVAETCGGAGDSTVFNSTEGVLYAEVSALVDDGTSRRITISDGSINNRVSIEVDEAANTLKLFIDSSVLIASGITLTNFNKISAKYKANDYALWVNGLEVGSSSTSSNVPTGLDRLNFDGGNSANPFYGNVKQVITFNTALSDTELAALTTL